MLVCHCRGITDRQIKRAVREGASSVREVARSTGAGMRCGGCRSNVSQLVNSELSAELAKQSAVTPDEVILPTVR